MKRFTSRKFIICTAAFLGSLGASIAAIQTDNEVVATIGIVCTMFSAAIYAAAEAYVDGKAVGGASDPDETFFEDDAAEEDEDYLDLELFGDEGITRDDIEKKEAE